MELREGTDTVFDHHTNQRRAILINQSRKLRSDTSLRNRFRDWWAFKNRNVEGLPGWLSVVKVWSLEWGCSWLSDFPEHGHSQCCCWLAFRNVELSGRLALYKHVCIWWDTHQLSWWSVVSDLSILVVTNSWLKTLAKRQSVSLHPSWLWRPGIFYSFQSIFKVFSLVQTLFLVTGLTELLDFPQKAIIFI